VLKYHLIPTRTAE